MDLLIKRLSCKQKVLSSDPQNLSEKLWRYQVLKPQHFLSGVGWGWERILEDFPNLIG